MIGTPVPYEYVVVRVVPRVDRGEFVNVGVLLHCGAADWFGGRLAVDPDRVRALDPDVDLAGVAAALEAVRRVTEGEQDPAIPAAAGPPGARFRWLAAPRSAMVQPSPIHTGLTDDPLAELERLFTDLVA
ncbi:DUF3037 domain-containing protein [Salsipaludibacter albus]|uniref:DUF3037 domain-containing protein n=1 Tax=Salsipaludibacter albus TaxID=2849650 RepID=UPI001EE4549C|nr:DUF3037 domain-containing protein [Salsipaludibacter albus]MBY5160878.1 DUF3037 domain-containing protein [Salsipaludibacter albus]